MYFLNKCASCTRYRKGKCRVVRACFVAMYDKDKFPFDDMRECGLTLSCRHYTENKPIRHRKQIDGQMALF